MEYRRPNASFANIRPFHDGLTVRSTAGGFDQSITPQLEMANLSFVCKNLEEHILHLAGITIRDTRQNSNARQRYFSGYAHLNPPLPRPHTLRRYDYDEQTLTSMLTYLES
jgi:hypothetical protein